MKRVLAIDFGEKRIGLALSIPLCQTHFAKPLKTVNREDLWNELDETFKNYEIESVVIGLPLRTDGTDADSVPVIRKLATEIGRKFNVPVKLWDERFSTKGAESVLRAVGKSHILRKDKKLVDKIAATIILEEYLDTLKFESQK